MANCKPWPSRRGQAPYDDVLVKTSRIQTGPELRYGGVFYPFSSEGNDWSTGRFHLRDFDDLSFGVISRPFTHLFAVPKISGTHFSAVFSEPLPISREHVINDVPPGFDASVLITVDGFFHAQGPTLIADVGLFSILIISRHKPPVVLRNTLPLPAFCCY